MTDAIVVGAGLSGLVAACELTAAGKHVTVLDQEPEQSLGGQAHWSLGGLLFVNSPEQRRLRIHDSLELARQDWLGAAGFDRPEDKWPRQWAEAYLQFAAGEKRAWLHSMGVRWFPVVGWAERGRNSVPRFHVTWGTGPAVLAPFVARARWAENEGRLVFRFRHRVDDLIVERGAVVGVRGAVLLASEVGRGMRSSREVVGDFELRAPAVIVASGGVGGDHSLVRQQWPASLGTAPGGMVCGVPASTDGRALAIVSRAGGRVINNDRMWHYTEGVRNWAPVWSNHGIRILPGPSSLWIDATGNRLPAPLFPGFDTLETLRHIRQTGFDYTWFILNQHIIRKEFALSGSEQNPDLTGKNIRLVLGRAVGKRAMAPIEAFKEHGADFVVRNTLRELVDGMNSIPDARPLDYAAIEHQVRSYDAQVTLPNASDAQVLAIRAARQGYFGDRLVLGRAVGKRAMAPIEAFKKHGTDFVVRNTLRELVDGMNAIPDTRPLDYSAIERVVRSYDEQVLLPDANDPQVLAIRRARQAYFGDRLVRVASPRPLLDSGAGPLIAVKLHVLTRKSLGGCETDLTARVLSAEGTPIPGMYAVGEAAGFGGGGVHGYRALEGTFLGGCLFTGRVAGRAAAEE